MLIGKADTMVRADHFASDDIKETMDNLEEGYSRLKDLSSLRKLRLNDAVESQQFYFKVRISFFFFEDFKDFFCFLKIFNIFFLFLKILNLFVFS